jgi:D-alanyl-D-alanine carboxypeptidase
MGRTPDVEPEERAPRGWRGGAWVGSLLALGLIGAGWWAFEHFKPRPAPPTVPPAAPAPVDPPAAPPSVDAPPPSAPAKPRAATVPGKPRVSCPGKSKEVVFAGEDGRLLGHWPYAEAPAGRLSPVPRDLAAGTCTTLDADALVALKGLVAAATAEDPALGAAIVALSCFRGIKYQREVFCRKVGDGFAARAKSSAPPGFSEHATGHAIDFGDRTRPECDLETCFSDTPVGRWLSANAGAHGFVLSFPAGNAQGVTHEPWHWRHEGTAGARRVFAAANGTGAANVLPLAAIEGAPLDAPKDAPAPEIAAGIASPDAAP